MTVASVLLRAAAPALVALAFCSTPAAAAAPSKAGAHSAAKARVMPSSPLFEEVYGTAVGMPR